MTAKILLIDDEPLLAKSVSNLLRRAGYHVTTASDGRAGLDAYERERPDIIITDIFMPVQEGIETIRLLRGRAAGLPIIAMSGGGQANNFDFLDMARKLGATTALAKPFTKEQLLDAVATCLRQHVTQH